MTSSRNPLESFILTPQQQSLLFAALNSNRATGSPNAGLTLSPASFTQSPTSKAGEHGSYQESPFLDYDYSYDGADASFDDSLFDQSGEVGKMIGDLPGASGKSKSGSVSSADGNELPEKRGHPDDDEAEENGAKRRESTEKVPKKPGRKPLTSEPTSKRKAQNRAAQRAFRERKEKHVKDLETKVEELKKASQAASNENGTLRAEVERLNVELNEYKKKLTLVSQSGPRTTFGTPILNNINDLKFEFPTFGALPGPPSRNSASVPGRSSSASKSPASKNSPITLGSPADGSSDKPTPDSSYSVGLDAQTKEDLAKFSGIFNPPLTNNNVAKASAGGSVDSQFGTGLGSSSSPSASGSSNLGPSSSCGTSPEPFTQSPMGFKPVDTLATIEENPSMGGLGHDAGHLAGFNMPEIDWLASVNNFQFDPQLFGQYREPQEAVYGNAAGAGDTFFNDAWDIDFTTPFNVAPSPVVPKKDLLAQIDAAKEADVDAAGNPEMLTCNKIWEQLQNCPKVQNGDFDLDGLCSELQKKAKCSGHGAVVDQKDFKTVMAKYLGKDKEAEACMSNPLLEGGGSATTSKPRA